MNKTFIALSAAAALTISFASCGGSGNGDNEKASSAVVNVDDVASKLRFYNPDSVAKHYILIEELNTQVQAALTNYQNEERKKANEIQRLGQQIQEKINNNGYLSEQSYNQDVQNFQAKQQQAEAYLAGLQQSIAEKTQEQSQMLLDSLNNFLADFNKQYNFDAILQIQPGYYIAPELDITDAVIEGLNARYKASHSDADSSK